ncbi:hypothetical protein TWF225_004282 [Orbilia oligospora]|uniref:Uncharacterized protein n=1 Tax=Orbilia oligospora TaxID=2813651 RepID=A0A8H2HTR4_ORBOL|nr:hypothetical protein TWF225_004282 [Orbilia oligospora]TGJ68747.1 hypothetical protein EYR41_004833 [Orbilia oligospora]
MTVTLLLVSRSRCDTNLGILRLDGILIVRKGESIDPSPQIQNEKVIDCNTGWTRVYCCGRLINIEVLKMPTGSF